MALARACYADADVYLLDDPLSAVDATVGAHIFQKCIRGLLAGKTRVLATHQLQYLPGAHLVMVLDSGAVQSLGRWVGQVIVLDRGAVSGLGQTSQPGPGAGQWGCAEPWQADRCEAPGPSLFVMQLMGLFPYVFSSPT